MAVRKVKFPIAYKLALAFIVVVVVAMGVLGLMIVSYQINLMREQINYYGRTVVDQYVASATEPLFTDDNLNLDVLTNSLVQESIIIGAAIYDDSGQRVTVAGDVPPESAKDLLPQSEAISDKHNIWHWYKFSDDRPEPMMSFLSSVTFKEVDGGYAIITLSAVDVRKTYEYTIVVLIATTLMIMLLAAFVAIWASRRMVIPLNQLIDATEKIAHGDYQIRLTEKRNDELGYLSIAFNRMVRGLYEKTQIEGVFSRILSNDVAEKLLSEIDDVHVGSERVDASVLFVDLVGFTGYTEQALPEDVVAFINECFSFFYLCAETWDGVVDKFIGDCMMMIFGAPKGNLNHRYQAVACGVMISRTLERLNAKRLDEGKDPIVVRIGINSGQMMAGIFGTERRMEYTVIGDAVNVAARLESIGEHNIVTIGEDILKSPDIEKKLTLKPYKMTMVKGRAEPLMTYQVLKIAEDDEIRMDNMIKSWVDEGINELQ